MFKNWKTALAGIIGAIAITAAGGLQQRALNPNAPPVTAGNIAAALTVAAIGALAKDHDK